MEWDRPNRSDWYAMQTAATILRSLEMQMKGLTPQEIREANFKLAFTSEARPPVDPADADADEEEYQRNLMEISKAQALARRGNRVVVEQAVPLAREETVVEQPDLAVDDATFAAMAARINADAAKEKAA